MYLDKWLGNSIKGLKRSHFKGPHHLVATGLTFQRTLCSPSFFFLSWPLIWFLTSCPVTQFYQSPPPTLARDDRKFNRLCKAVLVAFLRLRPLSPPIWWYLLLRLSLSVVRHSFAILNNNQHPRRCWGCQRQGVKLENVVVVGPLCWQNYNPWWGGV